MFAAVLIEMVTARGLRSELHLGCNGVERQPASAGSEQDREVAVCRRTRPVIRAEALCNQAKAGGAGPSARRGTPIRVSQAVRRRSDCSRPTTAENHARHYRNSSFGPQQSAQSTISRVFRRSILLNRTASCWAKESSCRCRVSAVGTPERKRLNRRHYLAVARTGARTEHEVTLVTHQAKFLEIDLEQERDLE